MDEPVPVLAVNVIKACKAPNAANFGRSLGLVIIVDHGRVSKLLLHGDGNFFDVSPLTFLFLPAMAAVCC